MYLRRHRRTARGATYEYWTLVESRRTASGPRQTTVATLGKLPGLDENVRAGWESLDALLEGRVPARQLDLSGKAQPPAPPLWREVEVRGVRVERVRDLGEVYLALALWRRLGLHTLLQELIPSGREEVALGTHRLPARHRPVLRATQRTGRGRALVSTHGAGRFAGRSVGQDQ
jgi:hypothetical protein